MIQKVIITFSCVSHSASHPDVSNTVTHRVVILALHHESSLNFLQFCVLLSCESRLPSSGQPADTHNARVEWPFAHTWVVFVLWVDLSTERGSITCVVKLKSWRHFLSLGFQGSGKIDLLLYILGFELRKLLFNVHPFNWLVSRCLNAEMLQFRRWSPILHLNFPLLKICIDLVLYNLMIQT